MIYKPSQEKQYTYAALPHHFVQTQCILKAFENFLPKKFDRKNCSGLAFELSDKLSFGKVHMSQSFRLKSLKRFLIFFRVFFRQDSKETNQQNCELNLLKFLKVWGTERRFKKSIENNPSV